MATLPRHPEWVKVRLPTGDNHAALKRLMRGEKLHTVCEEARCPNIGECWERRTATFMILGDICTRSCGFCAVKTGRPLTLDRDEPRRVAEAAARMGLQHVVVTSVNRDELEDGGAAVFAATIAALRERLPGSRVEVLIPDFRGVGWAIDRVLAARPDILNHNVETVPRLYIQVRPQARYERSLEVIARARAAGLRTKSGLMLGLGEREDELATVFADLRRAGCDVLTLGQYLQPTRQHLPVVEYLHPTRFVALREQALALGFAHVESGPLVRSSYHADEHAEGTLRGGDGVPRGPPQRLVLGRAREVAPAARWLTTRAMFLRQRHSRWLRHRTLGVAAGASGGWSALVYTRLAPGGRDGSDR